MESAKVEQYSRNKRAAIQKLIDNKVIDYDEEMQ